MHKSFSVMMLIALLGTASSSPAEQNADIPVKGYKLEWSDEFDGATLDLTKWDYRGLGPRRNGVNVKDTVSVNEGLLILTTKKSGDKYHTAMIGTQGKFETTFGYFECRVKLQRQVGHWSAFWLQTPTMGKEIGNPEESGTEIDIFEYLKKQGDKVNHAVHWDGYGETLKSAHKGSYVPGVSQGWHTFGLLWTESEYVFYIDGEKMWNNPKAISKRSEFIILSLEVGKWAGNISAATLPDSLYVDYVRVYKKTSDKAEPENSGDKK